MVLVDTSLWVAHLRHGHRDLASSLLKAEVVCHRFVIGELACGSIRNRNEVLSLLRSLPLAVEADHDEVMNFLERNQLMGKGLGLIDIHLMASAFLSGMPLWTLDNKLRREASRLGMAY
jgi:predicted nucleic acid-binding protein